MSNALLDSPRRTSWKAGSRLVARGYPWFELVVIGPNDGRPFVLCDVYHYGEWVGSLPYHRNYLSEQCEVAGECE